MINARQTLRGISIAFLPALALMAALLSGCGKSYPLGVSAQEWQSLSPERQAELTEIQEKIDRYKADEARCRQMAEVKVKTQVPVGGLRSSAEGMDISVGINKELYEECLHQAGWTKETLQPILYWMDDTENSQAVSGEGR